MIWEKKKHLFVTFLCRGLTVFSCKQFPEGEQFWFAMFFHREKACFHVLDPNTAPLEKKKFLLKRESRVIPRV